MLHHFVLTGIRTHSSEEIQKCILAIEPLGHDTLRRFDWDSDPRLRRDSKMYIVNRTTRP